MKVVAIRTHKITGKDKSIFDVLDKYLPRLQEGSVVAIASKIVGICEGRIVKKVSDEQKDDLARKEAEYFIPRDKNQYGFMMTINQNLIVASSGIDESNGNGYYVLWPKDPQKSADEIRAYLAKKFKLNRVGVIITDSKLTPLRWGVTGYGISYSGFRVLNSYVGKPDIFGRLLRYERTNVADSLASAAVVVTGEGGEQTPIAVIEDLPFVKFQKRNLTKKELERLRIEISEDVYAPILETVRWETLKSKNEKKAKDNKRTKKN